MIQKIRKFFMGALAIIGIAIIIGVVGVGAYVTMTLKTDSKTGKHYDGFGTEVYPTMGTRGWEYNPSFVGQVIYGVIGFSGLGLGCLFIYLGGKIGGHNDNDIDDYDINDFEELERRLKKSREKNNT